MRWYGGMQRDYDGWAASGAKGWSFADVLPVFKSQEDWEGGANTWRGAAAPFTSAAPRTLTPRRRLFLMPPARCACPFWMT